VLLHWCNALAWRSLPTRLGTLAFVPQGDTAQQQQERRPIEGKTDARIEQNSGGQRRSQRHLLLRSPANTSTCSRSHHYRSPLLSFHLALQNRERKEACMRSRPTWALTCGSLVTRGPRLSPCALSSTSRRAFQRPKAAPVEREPEKSACYYPASRRVIHPCKRSMPVRDEVTVPGTYREKNLFK
jgi:hypothetical protein